MWLLAALGLTALGTWLRFHHLGVQELWLDEALQLRMARADRIAEALRLEYSPPLGYLLWRWWIALFGESEVAVRTLAALFGSAFVPAAIVAGRNVLSPAAGLWAGAVAALAPLHIYYSQEARVYSLLCLTVLLSTLTLWRALERPSGARWAAFSGVVLLMLFVHHFGALALIPAPFLVWAWPRDSETARRWRSFLWSALAIGVPWLGWIAWSWLVNPQIERGYIWVRAIWENIPPALAIPKSFEVLTFGPQHLSIPGFFKQFTILEFPPLWRWVGVVQLAALGIFALGPWGDAALRIPWLGRRKVWLAALLLAPLLALWITSFFLPIYAIGRYDLIALPACVLLLGLAFAKLQRARGPRVAAAAAVLFFGILGGKLLLYYRLPAFSAGGLARPAAEAIDGVAADGDLVLMTAYRGATVGYYLRRLGYREHRGSFEHAETGRRFTMRRLPTHPSSLFFNVDHPERTRFRLETTRLDLRGYLAELDPERSTVWVEVLPSMPRLPRFKAMLAEELERAGFRPAAPPEASADHVVPYRHRGG